MHNKQKCFYVEIFEGNVLVVGKAGFGKTTFVKQIASNKLFVKLKRVEWLSQIDLSKFGEAEMEPCFSAPAEFYST